MGKKSREKRERREGQSGAEKGFQSPPAERKRGVEFFMVKIVQFGTYLILFAPLILQGKFYFPFVGPKSLYIMAGCQIVFFSWLFLAFNYKKYRPKINAIFLAVVLFLIILILSSFFGVDSSRSFWSKYERMTGLLMWLHLFGFFLAISCVFKMSDWWKVFLVSVFVSLLVSSISLLENAGVKAFKFSWKAGGTLGNTSFLGTYLLFNVFLALHLFFQKRNLAIKIFSLTAIVLALFTIYYAGARAALVSTLGGFGLIFLLWLAFRVNSRRIRILGKVLLAVSMIIVIASLTLLFLPKNFIHEKFIELTSRARFVNWEMAQKAFLERPLLGWGPENYTIAFTKFFDPCLFTSECGGEIWFDRTHNIIFDILVTIGIFGMLAYLYIFANFFRVFWRKYFKEKTIDFWTFSIFIALPIAYFIQNLTVFDMAVSLMMFCLILGFGGFLAGLRKERAEQEREEGREFASKRYWIGVPLIFVFLFTFSQFVIQPARADHFVIKILQSKTLTEKMEFYEKTVNTSPMGKYQIREFLAQQAQTVIQNNIQKIPKANLETEMDFLILELEKTRKESPLDFRSILRLAHLYNLYSRFDYQKLLLAEECGQEAIKLSPTNQQAYWVLAQTKLYQEDFEGALSLAKKAISLEPKWFQSHQIAVQVAKFVGGQELAEKFAQEALEVNPDWEERIKPFLE